MKEKEKQQVINLVEEVLDEVEGLIGVRPRYKQNKKSVEFIFDNEENLQYEMQYLHNIVRSSFIVVRKETILWDIIYTSIKDGKVIEYVYSLLNALTEITNKKSWVEKALSEAELEIKTLQMRLSRREDD